jgi:POT family proton-dependent oligopeptide transporter
MVMSVCLFANAISSALGEAFVCKPAVANVLEGLINDAIFTALSTDPLLVWNYGSMGVLSFIAGVFFWFTFRDLDAEEDELNQIPAGGF